MTDLNDHALSLLARTQLGSYLSPEERETVLSALYEVHALRKRAEAAEAKWALLLDIVNGSLAGPAPSEAALPPAPLPRPVQEPAGDVAPPRPEYAVGVDPGQPGGVAIEPVASREEGQKRMWGHLEGAAWHLHETTPDGLRSLAAICGEKVEGTLLFADKPIPDNACLDCAAIAGWSVPESPKEASGEEVPPAPPPPPEKRCAGLNKAANVRCGSTRIAVEVNGESFCMRHAPDRAARLAAKAKAEEAA